MSDVNKTFISENLAEEWAKDPFGHELWYALEQAEDDLTTAVSLMETLSAKGSILSKTYLGDLYFYGRFGAVRDFEKAQFWLEQASEGGSIEGTYLLALCLENIGDVDRAIKLHESLAKDEFPPSMFALGYEYWHGKKIERSVEQAALYFRGASKRGHIHSMLWLSRIMRSGALGKANIFKGYVDWLRSIFSTIYWMSKNPNSDRLRR